MSGTTMDEIDRILLRVLSNDPRMPYATIAEKLEEEGYEMSGEGIRYRVSKLLDATSTFFLLAPEAHDWEIVRLGITVRENPSAKAKVFDTLSREGFWLVCRGLGTTDLYAVATAASMAEIDTLVESVEAHEHVKAVDFSIETERATNLSNYFHRSEE